MRFFGARSPSKIAFIGAKGAFRKILGSVGQKWISEKVSKGGPFGSAGGQIPEGGASAPPPAPPLNPPLKEPKNCKAKALIFLFKNSFFKKCFASNLRQLKVVYYEVAYFFAQFLGKLRSIFRKTTSVFFRIHIASRESHRKEYKQLIQ